MPGQDQQPEVVDDEYIVEQSLESDICDRLRSLDLSEKSIGSVSDYLLRIKLPPMPRMNTTFLVDLLVRFILRSHRAKKLPYVYLANDLI